MGDIQQKDVGVYDEWESGLKRQRCHLPVSVRITSHAATFY